ncbi:EVE domain-containing protein [Candidatus Bathyarchaeota archaeon]|nr:EVE domain-containing protein [Candidatus Bathyarchaeota archaeon]
MASWLFVVTEENWLTVKNNNVFGVPERVRGRRATELVKPGDALVFYVSKKGSKTLGGMIVGVYRAVSGWFRDDKPLWPDEVREGVVKYPWRVRIEPVKLGVVSYTELAGRLSFVENKDRPHAYLVGTPANLRRPIPEGDFRVILEALSGGG